MINNLKTYNIKKLINSKLYKRQNAKLEKVLSDIQRFHNWSLYDEIFSKNKSELHRTALFYRGNNITYKQMLDKMMQFAKSLKALGIKKGDEIPACISNSPEFVYLLGAVSIIGAKLNVFGDDFDEDYITEIINQTKCDYIFVGDNKYPLIKDSIDKSDCNNVVMMSLADSLVNGKDPYEELDDSFYKFENKTKEYMNDNIMNQSQFIEKGENYTGVVKEKVDLDDEFTITYSSGSTNSSRPKAIVHKLRSYITMGTFHEPKVSNTPSMKNMRVLAHIPTHSNTNIMSCITDSLIEEATVCLEPIYDKDFFHSSLQINKPTFACATRSFWVNLSKIVIKLNKYNVNVKLPFLLVPMSVGEPLSRGEEELANKMCKLTDAGIEKTHTPKSVVTMSVAGGDCEHGGIFFIVFRNLMKKLKRMNDEDYDILRTYSMVDLAVLDADGNICKNGEIGRLYAKSPCNMKEYRNNPEANAKFFKEINGEIYGDCSVYGYIDDKGYIHVKGRINESCKAIPPFKISEEISKDTRNILSCETIEHGDDDITYACHIELQPETNADVDKVLFSALCRVKEALGNDVAEKVVFRVRNNVESFPLTDCGKRSNKKLEYEELENCVKVSLENNQIVMSPVEKRDENAKELIKNNMGFLK